MKKGKRLLCGALALLLVLSLTAVGTVQRAYATKSEEDQAAEEQKKAEEAAQRQAEMDELERKKQEKKDRIAELQKQIADAKSKKEDVMGTKTLLDQRNQLLMEEIDDTKAQIDLYAEQIQVYQEMEEEQYALFCQQVRSEEERGSLSYWSVLFKATSFSDLVSRIDFINEIVRYNQQVIKNLRDTRQQLADDKAALEEQNESLTASKKELEGEISESMRLLAEYIKTEEGKQAEYDAIKAEEEALDDLMAAAEAKARELGLNDIAGTVGGYIWPCNGIRWITSMFGGRQSPGGIGSTNHKGVDIGTPMGTPVLAAKSGTVTWASWNGGYGNCIIISHGNGNSTLYGHLSGYNVSTDQQVTQGQVIGYSGNTGNSTGPHLHFGIIENNSWIDPLNYLTGWQYYG